MCDDALSVFVKNEDYRLKSLCPLRHPRDHNERKDPVYSARPEEEQFVIYQT